jgi:hypothetical protein
MLAYTFKVVEFEPKKKELRINFVPSVIQNPI